MADDNNKPVHRIRLSTISAAVFANETDEGRTFYNVQFDRSYRDGDEWKHTKSFGWTDLLILSKVADLAHSWIHAQQQPAATAEPDSPAPY